jgi:hypothetical protein
MSEKNLQTFARMTEDEARSYLERLRWPDGPICPRCGVVGEAKRMESRAGAKAPLRAGVFNCRACRKPFTVTVATVLEGSHIPLSKWLMGFFLFASSKKSMSALQLQRQLGLGSYKSAWHMAHRIRHAMQNGGPFTPMKGIVEADECYIGGKPRNGAKPGKSGRGTDKVPVAILVSRDGKARAKVIPNVNADTLGKFLFENCSRGATLHTDEFKAYRTLAPFFAKHETTNHTRKEYARPGGIHSNTAESYIGLFKRGIVGSWHHVSEEHLHRYLEEFDFRWSNRGGGTESMMRTALAQAAGVRLTYRRRKGWEGLSAG